MRVDTETMTAIRQPNEDTAELVHRTKNLSALIMSMSRQTMRRSATKADFDERFGARLSAFCNCLDRLVANDWRGMSMKELASLQLASFGAFDGDQITLGGPDFKLAPEAAYYIGLALNELATNAAKYGALSVEEGKVEVNWEYRRDDDQSTLQLSWSETGGPAVGPSHRKSFGRDLIEVIVPSSLSARCSYEFLPAGIRWRLKIPTRIALA